MSYKANRDCLRGGCERWFYAQEGMAQTCYVDECWRCGFNILEDKRRKQIPLTLCSDGLRRKLIEKKPEYEGEKDVADDVRGEADSGAPQEDRLAGSAE